MLHAVVVLLHMLLRVLLLLLCMLLVALLLAPAMLVRYLALSRYQHTLPDDSSEVPASMARQQTTGTGASTLELATAYSQLAECRDPHSRAWPTRTRNTLGVAR